MRRHTAPLPKVQDGMSRRAFMAGAGAAAAIASSVAVAAHAQDDLRTLISDHLAAEIAAFHEEDAGDEAAQIEEQARLRLLRHCPATVHEAGQLLTYLTEVAWSGDAPDPRELTQLANTMTGGTA